MAVVKQKKLIINNELGKEILFDGDHGSLKKRKTRNRKKHDFEWHTQSTPLFPTAKNTPLKSSTPRKGHSQGAMRRAHQVSQVLYGYITQIVNSGELCPKIADLSVEITEVVILPDFSALHIYWMPTGTDQDHEINTLLKRNQNKLRTILTSYRAIAKIPEITIKPDLKASEMIKVAKLLETADYGTDENQTENREENQPEKIGETEDKIIERIPSIFDTGVTEVVHFESDGNTNFDIDKSENINKENITNLALSIDKEKVQAIQAIKQEFRNNIFQLDHSKLFDQVLISGKGAKSSSQVRNSVSEWDPSLLKKLPSARKHIERKKIEKYMSRMERYVDNEDEAEDYFDDFVYEYESNSKSD